MIRPCRPEEFPAMLAIINEAAYVYKGVVPDDCWHEPYMPGKELKQEISDKIEFWGLERQGKLLGIMGIQDKGEVTLIRHAYVRPENQQAGVGTMLLNHLEQLTEKPILIGTWAAATWAVQFYEKNGYIKMSKKETKQLLKTFWSIPDRQVAASVVLARNYPSQ